MAEREKGAGNRLTTFVRPRPSPALMKALAPVNRVVCLGGVPGLRSVPLLRRVPGLRGITDIVAIDMPEEDEQRLKASVGQDRATFITPNHPEFFTDWMLDKEILSRVAPMAASWATHSVVNGLGKAAQSFWLKNNLIAQIPGAGGAAGRTHSIEWALAGHGVLLHPEGSVGWHGDRVAPLFPGAVEMAAEASAHAAAAGRRVRGIVAPVVWKLVFLRDERAALEAEMAYVEAKLRLEKPKAGASLPERILAAYRELLSRDAAKWGVQLEPGPYAESAARLTSVLTQRLKDMLAGATADSADALRSADRWLRSTAASASPHKDDVRALVSDLRRIARFRPELYPDETLTQEHVAENIKRLRNDYCRGTLKDTMNAFVPRPVGPRRAIIRVPEAIDVTTGGDSDIGFKDGKAAALTEELRRRMQSALDTINARLDSERCLIRYANPLGA